MGPIRRSSSKRKAEAEPAGQPAAAGGEAGLAGQPAAADGEARGGRHIRIILRSSRQSQSPACEPHAHQIRALRRPRSPRTYRFLKDLTSADAVPCYTHEENKVDKSVKETRKDVATSEALITIPVNICEDNVAAMMKCKTSSAVATGSVSVTPLAMINDVVPNLLPSDDHDSPMTEYTANTRSPNKNLAAEEQQGVSLEDHDSRMTEYTAESSQSIGFSAVNQLFSTYLENSAEVEHDSTITDQPPESLSTRSQPFLKTLPLWEHIEEMEIFKKVPQRPHFQPLKKLGLGPDLCESMALGLMVFFGKTAENIMSLTIQDDNELFKEKLKGLGLLEDHGFDVTHLQSHLNTLLDIKNKRVEIQDKIKRLEEKITLKEIDCQQRGAQNGIIYTTICQLEHQANFLRCILKSSVSQNKTDILEISRLKTENSDLKKSYMSFDQQFSRVAAAPW